MLKKLTKEEIVKRAREIHGDKYDYSLFLDEHFKYKNYQQKIPIICHEKGIHDKEHGVFYQSYANHIFKRHGCPICGGSKLKTTEEFKNEAFKIWGDTYILDKCEYKNSKEKVIITCRKHGDFKITPSDFLSKKNGCPECKFDKLRKTNDDFVKESEKIFGKGTIIYDEVKYVNNQTKVALICPIHGKFWKSPNLHLSQHQGCPICAFENKIRSKLEEEIKTFLDEKGIHYIKEFKTEWLGKLTLDFYLPEYNVAIECQGIEHFQASNSKKSYFNEEKVNTIKERDKRKLKLCIENNVNLLYYSNLGIKYPYKVYENKEILLKNILNN